MSRALKTTGLALVAVAAIAFLPAPVPPKPAAAPTPETAARWACAAAIEQLAVDRSSIRWTNRLGWPVTAGAHGEHRVVAAFSGTNLFGGRIDQAAVCIVGADGTVHVEA